MEIMLREVRSAYPVKDRYLVLEFADGECRVVDVRPFLKGPMFQPLRDPKLFREVRVDADAGTVTWPNGVDLDPDVLYARSVPLHLPGEEAAEA